MTLKYLLDTHTLLWTVRAPEKLPPLVRAIVADPATVLSVSIATPWEMAIKAKAGKLDVDELLRNFDRWMAEGGYQMVETRSAQVIRAGMLPLHHRDPFDRLLAAQALELGAALLSRDPVFDRYGVRRVWE